MANASRGFSMVETMVVLAVLAIAATLALPSFEGSLRRTRTATALNRITASLALARGTAVMRRRAVSVCPSQDGRHCRKDRVWEDGWIVFLDDDKTGQPAAAADVLHIADPISDSLMLRATPGRHRARFQPNGQSTGSTLTLSLCLRDGQRALGQVVLNNWGRARVVRAPPQAASCSAAP